MKNILIVEDNDKNRYMISYILEKNNYVVKEVNCGQNALDLLKTEYKPDLILMDIQLPDINGLDLTRMFRLSSWNGKIPIIAITSYAMAGDEQKAMEAGCTGYIEKPINPETIIFDIKHFLREKP